MWFKINKSMLVVKFIYFITYGGRFAYTNYFAAFLKQSVGYDAAEIGVLFTLQLTAFFVGSMALSYFVEKTGRVSTTVFFSLSIVTLSVVMLPLAVHWSVENNGTAPPVNCTNSQLSENKLSANTNYTTNNFHTCVENRTIISDSTRVLVVLSTVTFGFFSGIIGSLDPIIICYCQLYSKKATVYDKQRGFGSLGIGMWTWLAGVLLELVDCKLVSYYLPSFLMSACAHLLSILCLVYMLRKLKDNEKSSEESEMTKESLQEKEFESTDMLTEVAEEDQQKIVKMFLRSFKKPEIVLVTVLNFLYGSSDALWYGFLLNFMQENMSNAHEYIFGLAMTVQCVVDLFVSRHSATIIRIVSNSTLVLVSTQLLNGVTFIATSYVHNSYIMPALAILPGVSFGIFLIPYQNVLLRVSDTECLKMIFSFQYGTYYFLGGGSTSFLTGMMYQSYGGRTTFFVVGVCLCGAYLGSILAVCYIKTAKNRTERNSVGI